MAGWMDGTRCGWTEIFFDRTPPASCGASLNRETEALKRAHAGKPPPRTSISPRSCSMVQRKGDRPCQRSEGQIRTGPRPRNKSGILELRTHAAHSSIQGLARQQYTNKDRQRHRNKHNKLKANRLDGGRHHGRLWRSKERVGPRVGAT